MKFSVPVVRTITGWVEIDADSLEKAKEVATELNNYGLTTEEINDAEDHDDVDFENITEITG